MNEQLLEIVAELSAQRAILVRLQVIHLLMEPDPTSAARALRHIMTARPTEPPKSGMQLDAATSDLLAAMTDERISEIMTEVQECLCKTPSTQTGQTLTVGKTGEQA